LGKESSTLFVRTSSGMVRELSPLVALAICISGVAIGIPANFAVTWTAGIYPGADFIGSITIALIPCVFFGLLYVLFTISMPRSGGDYVYTSRILHPVAGFTMNFMFTIWTMFFMALNASVFIDQMLAPVLASYGLAAGNHALIDLAALLATDLNIRFVGALISILIVFIVILFGARYTGRWLLVLFFIGLAGIIANIIIYLAPSKPFPEAYMAAFGESMEDTVARAEAAGWSYIPSTLELTLSALPFAFVWYIGFQYSAYVAGEVKEVKKSMWISILGALFFGWIMYSIIGALFLRISPEKFTQAISYLFFAAPEKYTLPTIPGAYLFAGVISPHPILNLIILIAQVCWSFAFMTVLLMVVVRNIFAWAFDRIVPTRLADINRRFNSPIKASIVAFIVVVIFLYLYIYTEVFKLTVNYVMAVALALIVPSVAGIVFPFRRKELYQKSPASAYKVGGVPLISIAGAISLIFFIYLVYAAYTTPGVFGPVGLPALSLILLTIIFPIVVYYVSKTYHQRKEGIDISLAFTEIPPG